jgi:hypothetical protein
MLVPTCMRRAIYLKLGNMLYSGEDSLPFIYCNKRIVSHPRPGTYSVRGSLYLPLCNAFREGLHGLMRPIDGPRVDEIGEWLATAVS